MTVNGRSNATTVPTVIGYFGPAPDYVRLALESAARFNSQVVLVGDRSNRGAWNNHADLGGLEAPKFEEFQSVYTKMSDYPDFYERAFWQRPFHVECWMRSEGVNAAMLLDSDVVTFADYSRDVVRTLPADCGAALMTPHDQSNFGWATSLHFSYWTLDALSDFTSFCIEAYRTDDIRRKLEAKYRWHLSQRMSGGVCEMTLLYLWQQRRQHHVVNLAQVRNGVVADQCLSTSSNYLEDEYELRRGFKKLTFRGGLPYGANRMTGEEVRFLSIHCQGASKRLMRSLHSPRWRRFYTHVHDLTRVVDSARTWAHAR